MSENKELNEFMKIIKDEYSGDEYLSFFNGFQDKRYRLSDTQISPRVYSNWKKSDLIFNITPSDNRSWVNLSISDFIWCKIIEKMRFFGLPFSLIMNAKDFFEKKQEIDDSYESFEEFKDDFLDNEQIRKLFKNELGKNINELSNKEIRTVYNITKNKKRTFTNLDQYILLAFIRKYEVGFFMSENQFCPYIEKFHNLIDYASIMFNSHIYISISEIVTKFLIQDSQRIFKTKLNILSQVENEVINFLSKEDFNDIRITKGKNKIIFSGKYKKEYDREAYMNIKRQFELKYPYSTIEEQNNGNNTKILVFTVKSHVKINEMK